MLQVRSPKEVEKTEYSEFFKATFKEFLDPLAYAHFNTEVSAASMCMRRGASVSGTSAPRCRVVR